MLFRSATLSALVVTSSAWLPPPSLSTKRFIDIGPKEEQLNVKRNIICPSIFRQLARSSNTVTMTTIRNLRSAVAAEDIEPPSSVVIDAVASTGHPIAKGSIVNTFRGGLVAAKIDDDLTKVMLKSNNGDDLPGVVDTKEAKLSSNALGKEKPCVTQVCFQIGTNLQRYRWSIGWLNCD